MDIQRIMSQRTKQEREDVLSDELGGDWESLPLDAACDHGGFPDPEDIEVMDVQIEYEDEEILRATFQIAFTEAVGTSCSDVTVPFSHCQDCTITIDKIMREAEIVAHEQEYTDEF